MSVSVILPPAGSAHLAPRIAGTAIFAAPGVRRWGVRLETHQTRFVLNLDANETPIR